jgi:Aspartyl protease/PDZ domain
VAPTLSSCIFIVALLLMGGPATSAPAVAQSAEANAASLLAANHAAVGDDGKPGTIDARFAYSGQGLTGEVRNTSDRATGAYVDRYDIGPQKGASGFDGRMAWMQDISGAYTPQDGGDRPAVATNEAYRNANLWWRADRGGAVVEFKGRETIDDIAVIHLRVSPRGGKPFDAWFDATTHLLLRVDEPQQFFNITTRYRDFAQKHGMMVPHTVTVDSGTGPAGLQTMKLTRFDVEAARPMSAYSRPSEAPTGAAIEGGAVNTTVPIRLANNHIFVDAVVNGKGPFPFIVDTGGHTILTPSTVAALGLATQGEAPSAGAGEQVTTSGYAKVREIAVGDMRMRDQTAFTLDFAAKATEGFEVGGMIGFEFFRRFAVRIDYGSGTMTIIDPARFDPTDAGTPIPFLFYDHMPQVDGRLGNLPGRFAIDTGSRSEVDLTTPFVERARLRDAYPDGVLAVSGWGVGGPVKSQVVRAKSLTLGNVTVASPVASLSTSKAGSFSDANYEGNVGSGFLKRFIVTFDYAHQVMYLKPIVPPPVDTGTFDKSGIWINLGDKGFEVVDVAENSPAKKAGLVVGDIIVGIDEKAAGTLSLSDARQQFRMRPDGTVVRLDIVRAGIPSTINIELRSQL